MERVKKEIPMKKIILALVIVAVAAVGTWFYLYNGFGCVQSKFLAKQNNKNIAKLRPGMTKAEVLKLMGPPNKIEVYSIGSRIFEFLLYRTTGFCAIFKDKDANFLPVAVESQSGVVLSLDRKFYREVMDSRNK